MSLGRTACRIPPPLGFWLFLLGVLGELNRKDGGGVSGGSGVSRNRTLGVPGWDSHLNGTPTGARP